MNVATIKLLQNTYKSTTNDSNSPLELQDEPVEGFTCIPSERDFLNWAVYIEGPKDTP